MGGRRPQGDKEAVAAYLGRIGAPPGRGAGLGRLTELVRCHLEAVPFENLDVWRRRPLSLEQPALFDKIVRRRRGGFCYELNGLFAWLLGELGFQVERREARVVSPGRLGPPFDHLTLAVRGEGFGPHLVDVGFGEGPRRPLALAPGTELEHLGMHWVIEEAAGGDLRLLMAAGLGPADVGTGYLVSPPPRRLVEFEPMCHYHQRSPDSPFTQGRLCTLATRRGRITLANDQLRTWHIGSAPVHRAVDESELDEILRSQFGVVLEP